MVKFSNYSPPTPREPTASAQSPWARLSQALAWCYGPERRDSILAGHDEATNADLAAWRRLGR